MEETGGKRVRKREGRNSSIMMVPVADEEDDFIVQSAALVEEATAGTQQEDVVGWRQYGLQKLGGLVFAKGAETVVESEPTLPTGFSATLNAEEEEIYPAEVRRVDRGSSADQMKFNYLQCNVEPNSTSYVRVLRSYNNIITCERMAFWMYVEIRCPR